MKRGSYSSEAVVLGRFDYGESDAIVSLYTARYGKLKGIAKGALRSRKRFVATLEPPSLINVDFFVNGRSELVRLEDTKLIDSFAGLKSDIERLTHSCYMLELSERLTREGQIAKGFFTLLSDFLSIAGEAKDLQVLSRFFEVKALSILGYMPHLDGCVLCSKESNGERAFFSSEKGGLVCSGCASARTGLTGLLSISNGTVGTLDAAARMETAKLKRLHPARGFANEAERALSDFIRYHTGAEFKTRKFMEELRRAGA